MLNMLQGSRVLYYGDLYKFSLLEKADMMNKFIKWVLHEV